MSKAVIKRQFISFASHVGLRQLNHVFLKDRVTIFYLHRFTSSESGTYGHDPEFVLQAIQTLRRIGIEFTSIRELLQAIEGKVSLKPGTVAFTIDDGYLDQANVGAEIFLEENCPLTMFLITGFLDGINWPWDARLSWLLNNALTNRKNCTFLGTAIPSIYAAESDRKIVLRRLRNVARKFSAQRIEAALNDLASQYNISIPSKAPRGYEAMTWEQARSLETLGVDFAPHTVAHYAISGLTESEAKYEIEQSWNRLQSELTNPVPVLGWPTGRAIDFSGRDINIAQSVGLKAALSTYTTYATLNGSISSRYQLGRFSMPENDLDVIQYATWIERAKEVLRLGNYRNV